jgi:hypothetical protein
MDLGFKCPNVTYSNDFYLQAKDPEPESKSSPETSLPQSQAASSVQALRKLDGEL